MSLSYTIESKNAQCLHRLLWSHNVSYLINDVRMNNFKNLITEYHTPSQTDPSQMFRLKMQCVGDRHIKIYYCSCISVLLDVYMNVAHINVVDIEEVEIPAVKWQHICNLGLIISRSNLYVTGGSGHSVSLERFNLLNIDCTFTVQKSNKTVSLSQTCEIELSHDLRNLLTNELFPDAILKCAEGTEFKVHKGVLANRCEVIKAHFEHNTTECHTNVIESHFEPEVIQEVLLFIYSDKALRVDEIPEKLLAAADYYQLRKLKSQCEVALQKKLTVENVLETLKLADLHSAHELQQVALKCIKKHLSLIIKTECWAEFKSLELTKRIVECMADDNEAVKK